MKDVPDAAGITVSSDKQFTVDFGGHTYTLKDPGAGSSGTETNGFQLLMKDVPDAAGITVSSDKQFTVDFGGHTYTLKDPGAGSSGTETNGFQLLKNSTITFKNGTIRIAEGTTSIKRIIQNYANLTLEDMHFYAENQAGSLDYPLSFNNGSITFKLALQSLLTSSLPLTLADIHTP